jgi:glycerol-3-phosphate dehydrogenase (NAD(P)+)
LSYAGVGDLVLTSFSENSRNYQFGNKVRELDDTKKAIAFFQERQITVEGLNTIFAFEKFLERKKIKKPLFFQVMSEIIFKNKS